MFSFVVGQELEVKSRSLGYKYSLFFLDRTESRVIIGIHYSTILSILSDLSLKN